MGILDFILTAATEATVTLSSQEVSVAAAPNAVTSWIDVASISIICATVIVCVWIMAYYLKKILSDNKQKSQGKEENCDNPELSETDRTEAWKEKERYDAAWRIFDRCWKTEHPEPVKTSNGNFEILKDIPPLTDSDKKRYDAAWDFINQFISAKPDELNKANRQK